MSGEAELAAIVTDRVMQLGRPAVTVDDPTRLVALATHQRVLALVGGAVRAERVVGFDDAAAELLFRHEREQVVTAMGVVAMAGEIVDRLAAAGLGRVIVVKGCATGQLDYERGIERFTSDVDLLLPFGDHLTAATVLDGGARRLPARPRERSWEQAHLTSITVDDASGVEIDIHQRVVLGYDGYRLPAADLDAHTVSFDLGGTPALALDAPYRLIHAALHLALSTSPRLHTTIDVVRLAAGSDDVWDEAIERSRRHRIDAMFACGVQDAWSRLGAPDHPLARWADGVAPDARQRLARRIARGGRYGPYLTPLAALPVSRWPGYLLPLLAPSDELLDRKSTSWWRRTRRTVTGLVAAVRPRRR